MTSVVVFGGYGVFGSLIATELARSGFCVTVAGRNLAKTKGVITADVTSKESCKAALQNQDIAVHCAGPFAGATSALLDACLEAGCHYVDIADDRGYVALVRSYGPRFLEKNLAAVYGCSSLPGISGALALAARAGRVAPLKEARTTLFIGNKNPKGQGAIASVVRLLGKGFPDHFESPEYDLFPSLLSVKSVSVNVVFELPMSNFLFKILSLLPIRYGSRTTKMLQILSRPFKNFGHSGGAVTVELIDEDGSIHRSSLTVSENGQRMAILPCVYAVQALSQGVAVAGAFTAYELLGASDLLKRLIADGAELELS